jgi:hypothetical protein
MAKRWVIFENELAAKSPEQGDAVAVRLPHGFKLDRDELRLLRIARKYGAQMHWYDRGWRDNTRYVWLGISDDYRPDDGDSVPSTFSLHRTLPRRSLSPRMCARRNNRAGKKWRSKAIVQSHASYEWAELALGLSHFGGFLIAHGSCGDSEGEGATHLTLSLPHLFNVKKDAPKLLKLTTSLGLVWVGYFLNDNRHHGLWVAPEKGLSFTDALLLLEKKGGHEVKLPSPAPA